MALILPDHSHRRRRQMWPVCDVTQVRAVTAAPVTAPRSRIWDRASPIKSATHRLCYAQCCEDGILVCATFRITTAPTGPWVSSSAAPMTCRRFPRALAPWMVWRLRHEQKPAADAIKPNPPPNTPSVIVVENIYSF